MSRIHAPKWPFMHALLAQGAAKPTHERLSEVSFVNRRTISKILHEAKPGGLLIGGRPCRFGPGMGLAVGVSLGSQTLRAGLVDCNGIIHHRREAERQPGQLAKSPRALLPRIKSLVADVLTDGLENDVLRRQDNALALLGIAVAWPVPMDRSKRVRGRALRDASWKRRHPGGTVPTLPEFLSSSLGRPFSVDRCHAINDVSAAALGVAFRESRERTPEESNHDEQWRVGLTIRVGGGLGSGITVMAPPHPGRLSFIDSQLIEGTNGLAGELGHLPIGRRFIEELNETCDANGLAPIDYEHWECSCGRKHHLEAFASGSALMRRLRASGYEIPDDNHGAASLVTEMIRNDEVDDGVIHALTDVGRILGRALTGPILMLDPFSITITGSLASDSVVEGMWRERDKWANAISDSVRIAPLTGIDGAYIGVQGAGLAIIRRAVYRKFLDAKADRVETFDFSKSDLAALHKS